MQTVTRHMVSTAAEVIRCLGSITVSDRGRTSWLNSSINISVYRQRRQYFCRRIWQLMRANGRYHTVYWRWLHHRCAVLAGCYFPVDLGASYVTIEHVKSGNHSCVFNINKHLLVISLATYSFMLIMAASRLDFIAEQLAKHDSSWQSPWA